MTDEEIRLATLRASKLAADLSEDEHKRARRTSSTCASSPTAKCWCAKAPPDDHLYVVAAEATSASSSTWSRTPG